LRVIDIEALAASQPQHLPYLHFIGSKALKAEAVSAVLGDFPAIAQTGFIPVGDLHLTGGFKDLVADTEDPAFSAAIGDKLGLDLVHKPRLATLRHRSAASDGRIHTDSDSKIATVLIYLNASWTAGGAGQLRVLRSGTDFEDYSAQISPVLGNIFGFRRAANSWHGHLPFAGERKVLQITWLTDDSHVARKTQTAKISRWLKRLNPFG